MQMPEQFEQLAQSAGSTLIIPDSVADFAQPPARAEASVESAATPAQAFGAVTHPGGGQVASRAETVAKAGLSTVASIHQSTKTEIKTTMDKAMKTAEEFVTFGQGNLEAMMKSSQIWMAGLQEMSKVVAATAQAQVEETVSTMKTLAGLRSIKDSVDLQTSFARTSFEKAMSESGKITEHSMKLAAQTLAPITARVNVAVEKFGSLDFARAV